jgi:hypothetical protein
LNILIGGNIEPTRRDACGIAKVTLNLCRFPVKTGFQTDFWRVKIKNPIIVCGKVAAENNLIKYKIGTAGGGKYFAT